MFVGDYIDRKPNGGIRTLTKLEAGFFGESYPLKAGWFGRLRGVWMDDQMMAELRNRLETSAAARKNKKRSTKKSLAALASLKVVA